MKTIHMTFGSIDVAVLACIPATANSQAVSQSAQAAQSGPCFVSERGPHHRTWSKIITFEDASGNGDSQTNTAYVELATGMHYKGPGNEWLESSEEIELLPNGAGAKADRGQHKAFFPPDIHSGVVELCTPDGKWLKSQVLGLGYFDTATGKSVLITELKSSIGELHPPNAVIYPDSFSDGVQADIRYTYTLNGFEQDIILKSKLPSFPEDYSMNPGTTKLQVFTEFFDSPQPAIEQATLQTFDGRTFSDQTVGFGSFYIGQGKAFSTERPQQEIPVRKEWLNFEGRQFLIEEAPLPELQRELDVLPAPEQASLQSQAGDSLRVASLKRLLPVSKAGRKAQGEMRLSVLSTRPKGLVLDYVGMTSGQHNYVFRGDTTYYLSASVSCYGTTTFEGGSVLKYATAGRLNMTPGPPPYYTAAIDWKGAPYRPVILTSKDDDSVGEVIQGSSGDPTLQAYGNPMLYMAGFSPAPTIACARFAWANQAIYLAGVSTSTFSHVQFVNCQEGIGFGGSGATLRNCLLANVGTCFNTSGGLSASAESCTFSGNDYLGAAPSYPTSSGITFVNCVLANVAAHTSGNITLAGHHNGFYETPTLGSPPYYQTQTSPFVEAGAGDYYLSDGSGFRNVGTILLYAPLLDELRKKTTRPPLPLTGPITVNTALPRREIRDPGCDLGYHYDPLDWLIESISLQNATLTIRDGAAIGITCGTSQDGIVLKQGGKLDATGSFRSPNHIVRYTAVQEQASAGTIGIGGLIGTDLSSFSGEIHLQSTVLAGQHSLVSAHGITEASFRDCEFYGGSLTVGADGPETALWATSNCLLHRIRSFATPLDCLEAFFYNNLFFEGSVETDIPWATTFHFRDNFFYRTMLGDYGCTPLLDRDYNAYITGYG